MAPMVMLLVDFPPMSNEAVTLVLFAFEYLTFHPLEKKPEFYRLKKYFKLATLTEAALNFYENR